MVTKVHYTFCFLRSFFVKFSLRKSQGRQTMDARAPVSTTAAAETVKLKATITAMAFPNSSVLLQFVYEK